MKFLPENPKKLILTVIVLLVSVGGIVYFNLFYGKGDSPPRDAASLRGQNSPPPAPSGQDDGQIKPVRAVGGLLPYGPKIDMEILEHEKFKSLRGVPPVSVRPEELGKPNPFSR